MRNGIVSVRLLSSVLALLSAACSHEPEIATSGADQALSEPVQGATLGLYEGVRASNGPSAATLDTAVETFAIPKQLTLYLHLDQTSPNEGDDLPDGDLFETKLLLTFDEYVRLFESAEDVSIPQHVVELWPESAEASGPKGDRHVVIRWDNSNDENTRKGELAIHVGANGIDAIHVTRWHKRFLFGWSKIFDETVDQPARTAKGLLLVDDSDDLRGRVTEPTKVKKALEHPTPETFQELLGQ